MGRVISRVFFVVLFAVSAAMLANAQISVPKLTLPFEFWVVDQTFPAGTYDLKQENPNTKLTIRGNKGGAGIFATVNLPPKGVFEKDKTWLVFRKYGEKYFLTEVWSKKLGVQFPVGTEEKRLKESGVEPVQLTVNVKQK
jgi:hypothetical protein